MKIFKRKIVLPSTFILEVVLILLGLLMFSFGTIKTISNLVENKYYEKVTGTVSQVIDTDTLRAIYVKYTYDGVEYENKLAYWNAELDLNDSINILVNSKDPNVFKTNKSLSTFSLIFLLVIGLILFIYNFTYFYKYIKLNNKINKILKNGKCETLKVISIEENEHDISLDVTPKVIECITSDGLPIQSYNIYTRKELHGYVNKYLDVYYIGEKISNLDKNYYIDFDSLKDNSDKTNTYVNKFEE